MLFPAYVVIPVTGDIIIKEPWISSCALLVFPGGADIGYCRTLNGEGNRRISRYVNAGGSYLGFCAGGYYGCAQCEFEVDDPKMAVVGERELGFYPGTCRGLAFEGFVYSSEAGARAADLKIHMDAFADVKEGLKETFKSYYNGGGVFVDAKKLEGRGVEVLASYTEDLHVDAGEGAAAVVYRKIGEGHAVLTGPHPEYVHLPRLLVCSYLSLPRFAPTNLTKSPKLPSYSSAIDAITATDSTRIAFMRLLLTKLGLKVNEEEQAVPSLSRLHLSSHTPTDVADLVASWSQVLTVVDGEEYIKCENDVFRIEKGGAAWGVQGLKKAVEAVGDALPAVLTGREKGHSKEDDGEEKENIGEGKKRKTKEEEIRERIEYTTNTSPDQILDYDALIKTLVPHDKDFPASNSTPNFNHSTYYANLAHYDSSLQNPASASFGRHLLYGSVVTSTNTLLEKNPTFLRNLPTGFTLTATTQLTGRGRGSNVWVAPPGALMFSTVIHHDFTLTQSAPVIFIQYIAALAIVRGIKAYAPGYSQLAVKLKWPNDIYAQLPGSPSNPLVKIGGILVNSSYSGSSYSLVVGIGLNLDNPLPTTSLNQLVASATEPRLKPLTPEKLLASILAQLSSLYASFARLGFTRDLEREYYDSWLHTEQIVTLETHGGVRARIKGITRDWGLLLAEELAGTDDRPTGRMVSLQSDSNSFDFFRGLVRRKV